MRSRAMIWRTLLTLGLALLVVSGRDQVSDTHYAVGVR
jgi:hypothetical protein